MTPELLARVLGRLGLARAPEPGIEGLRTVYAAWCVAVPFDNLRKLLSLRESADAPLPGGEAVDFFEHWLEYRAGGTCWPTSNALFTLLHALGFDARRVAGSMGDVGAPRHGTVKVRIDGVDWLVDSAMLTVEPLPLREAVFVHQDPVFAAQVEPVGGTHLLWFELPPGPSWMPCRILDDPVDYAFFQRAYEASRERSPFNTRLYARCNRPGELRLIAGNVLHRRTAGGIESRALTRPELERALCDELDVSPSLVERCARAGCLDASFEPPPEPPALPPRLPPSMRAVA